MHSKCIIFNKSNSITLGEIDVPAPIAGQMLTRTLYAAVDPLHALSVKVGGIARHGVKRAQAPAAKHLVFFFRI